MPGTDDHIIHQLLLQQDPAGLDALVAQHSARVCHLTRLIVGQAGGPEDAEEAASDAFAAAWRRVSEFDPARGSLSAWVLMLAKYAALERRRHLLRQRYNPGGEARVVPLAAAPAPPTAATPEDQLLQDERRRALRLALDRLPAADRDLLVRRYFLEVSIPDLCREHNLSRGALDNRLWRARRALRAALDLETEVTSHD